MMNSAASLQNHLLGALPADKYTVLFSQLEFVKLSAGDVLYEPGEVHSITLIFPRPASFQNIASTRMDL